MTRIGARVLVAAMLSGCSSLGPNDAGVSSLELRLPICGGIELGSTVELDARTFNEKGDSIDAEVRWRTPDPAAIDLDGNTGLATGLVITDTARVQAIVGSKDPIVSDLVFLVVTPFADTLIRASTERVTVDRNAQDSGPISVTVSRKSPAEPVKSFPLRYRVIAPVFANPEDRTVEFAGGTLSMISCSGPAGTPQSQTELRRRSGRAQPDSAIVEVSALHADGRAVPGSGQRFTMLFKPPQP